jgi:hypothetical protein
MLQVHDVVIQRWIEFTRQPVLLLGDKSSVFQVYRRLNNRLPDGWKQADIAWCAALGIPVPPNPEPVHFMYRSH